MYLTKKKEDWWFAKVDSVALAMIINTISKIASRFTSQNKHLVKKINATHVTVPFQCSYPQIFIKYSFGSKHIDAEDTKVTIPQYLS